MSQTVLVTGGNGFIAVHVIQILLEHGHSVVTTVRSEGKTPFLKTKFASYGDKLRYSIVPDITTPGAFDNVFKTEKFDAVLHLSSPFTFNIQDVRADLLGPAIQGTKGILDSVDRLAADVKRVVVTSSFASVIDQTKGDRPGYVYSDKDWNPITFEESLVDAGKGYYGSKKFAEKAAWDFIEERSPKFKLITLCPPMVFGPVIQEVESLSKLNTSNAGIYNVVNGAAEPANSVWLWVDVRDIALAHVLAIENPNLSNERFLITQGTYSAQEIVDFVWERSPERAKTMGVSKGTPGKLYPETGTYKPDNSKSKELLGLEYRSFRTMLGDLIESFERLEREGK